MLHGLETSLKAQTWGGSRPFLPFLQDLVITLLLVEGKRPVLGQDLSKCPNAAPSKYFPPHILLLKIHSLPLLNNVTDLVSSFQPYLKTRVIFEPGYHLVNDLLFCFEYSAKSGKNSWLFF